MKLLVDINHPAHVHYFKNAIRLLRLKGHQIFITSRNRYPAQQLLEAYGESYYDRGKGSKTVFGKLLYIPVADFKLLKFALRIKPDIFLSFGTPYPNHVAWLLRKPSINFQDTENAGLMLAITRPFSSVYCTPYCYKQNLGDRHIRFKGYMELSYLHPNYFTPKEDIFRILEIDKGEPYVIIRFVSWQASHDIGHNGLSLDMKRKAVEEFSKYARVFITSEEVLPDDLKPFQVKIPPERMHDALAFASMLYGESATMASECAVLGVPSIYLDDQGRGYTDEEEEKYGLVFNFNESRKQQEDSINKGIELLNIKGLRKDMQTRRQQLLSESIDVTDFMVWLLDRYPQSWEILKENPFYQERFGNTVNESK